MITKLNQKINCLKDEPNPKQVIRVEISDISYTDNFNDDERQYARWGIYMSPIEHNLAQLAAYFYLDINEDGGTFGKKLTRWLKLFEKFADEDAIYSNVTTSLAYDTKEHVWRTSPLFASMGIVLPGGIAAKKTYPNRQVWNLIGDGAFSMTYPDVVTNVRYDLPVINVVFTNTEYGFIKNKYEDTNKYNVGVDFTDVDYAKLAEAQGTVGLTVNKIEDIDDVMKQSVGYNKQGRTVVVDAKITKNRPIPVETLKVDPKLYGEDVVNEYKAKYEAEDLVPLREFLEQEGLESKYIKADEGNKFGF